MDYLFSILLAVAGLLTPSFGSQGIQQLQLWKTAGGDVQLASTTASIRVPFLASLDCIGTDGDGVFGEGTCTGGGGGGGDDPFTHPAAGQSATTSLMLFNGNASTTRLSATRAWFGGTATSTFAADGELTLPNNKRAMFSNLAGTGNAGQIYADASNIFQINTESMTNPVQINGSYVALGNNTGNVGVGVISPSNKLHVLSATTPQVRFAYDGSNYYTTAVSSAGAVTFDATGSGSAFTFSDKLNTSNASSTLFSTGYASSTLWYGGGLASTCASGNFLTWTAGQFGCAADTGGSGGLSSYDAWTHPSTGYSATTSILFFPAASSTRLSVLGPAYFGATATSTFGTDGGLSFGDGVKLIDSASASTFEFQEIGGTSEIMRFGFENNAVNWATGSGITVMNFASMQLRAEQGSTNNTRGYAFATDGDTGLFSASSDTLQLKTGGTERLTIDANGLVTVANASSTLFSTGYASSTVWRGGGLVTDCDADNQALGWDLTSGQFTCGDDDGGGGSSEWTDAGQFLYPNEDTDSVVIGADNQAGIDSLVSLFATSTTGYLLYGATVPDFDTDIIKIVNSSDTNLFVLSSSGTIQAARGLYLQGDDSELLLGSTGVFFTQDQDGALTITGQGDSNNEGLTVNLDDTADTVVWSSDTGVATSTWSGIGLQAFGGYFSNFFRLANDVITDITGTGLSIVGGALGVDLTANFSWTGTHDFSGGVLKIPNGTNPTVDATGELAWDTTSGQAKLYDGAAVRVLSNGYQYASFSYSTSSPWVGTTTIPLGPAGVAETWSQAQCFTDAGTVQVSFNDGTNRMNWMNASTTVGIVGLTSNNTFTLSEKRYVDVGTPASSPTKVSCTVRKAITAD